MAATFDASTGAFATGTNTLSTSHTAAGTGLAAFIGVGNSNGAGGANLLAVLYGAASATTIWNEGPHESFFHNDAAGIAGIGAGSATVAVTLESSVDEIAIGVITANGVDQTTPFGTYNYNHNTGTSASVVVATAAGDLAVANCYSGWSAASAALGTNAYNTGNSDVNLRGAYLAASGSTATLQIDKTSAGFVDAYLIGGVAFKAAASGGISGVLTATLDTIALAATGVSTIAGTAGITLAAATLAATGTSPISGSLGVTLGACTASSTGTSPISGQATPNLADSTLAATGVSTIAGTAGITLAAATLAATGTSPISGSLGVTLDACAIDAQGAGSAVIVGTLTATLDTIALAAAGVSTIAGTAGITLAAATLAATGTSPISGSLGVALDACTASATGESDISGQATPNLADSTLVATGVSTIAGTAGITLDACTLAATGVSTVVLGVLNVTLADLTCSATNVVPEEPSSGGSSGGWGRGMGRRRKGNTRTSLDWTPDRKPEAPKLPPNTGVVTATLEDTTLVATAIVIPFPVKARQVPSLDDLKTSIRGEVSWPPMDSKQQLIMLAILDFEHRRRA